MTVLRRRHPRKDRLVDCGGVERFAVALGAEQPHIEA